MEVLEKVRSLAGNKREIIKALVFGAAWLILPFWVFLLVALYLYFFPFFRPFDLFLPFAILIFFAAIEPTGTLFALLLGVIFYLILGIKDLIFIGRKSAYEVLSLILMFLALMKFFSKFDSWGDPGAFFWIFLLAAIFFFLAKDFLRNSGKAGAETRSAAISPSLAAGISAMVFLQISIATLFLPLNLLYQSALVFLMVAITLELAFDYSAEALSRRKILISFSIFFSFLVVILGAAQWGL